MKIEPSMSQVLSLFAVASAISTWLLRLRDVTRPPLRDFALLRLAGGLVMPMRTQDTTFLAIPLVFMAAEWVRCLHQPDRPDLAHWSAGLLIVAFGIQAYVVAAWWGWSQGDACGGRVFLSCLWLWAIGLAAVFAWAASHRRWIGLATGLSALLIAWNTLSFTQYSLALISHSTHPSLWELTIGRLLVPQQT